MVLNLCDKFFSDWRIPATVITLAGLLLAYSLLSVPPPLAPSLSVPDSWGREFPKYEYAPSEEFVWIPKHENQTVQRGDLLLEGGDVLLIENCTYVLNGQLLAKDNARLILRNAELYIQEKREWAPAVDLIPGPVHMGFNDSAVFEAHNSSIIYPDWYAAIGFFQNSKAIIGSSRLDIVNIYGDEESIICISNSTIGPIRVAGGVTCEIINSEVSSISCYSIIDRMKWFRSEGDWEECRVEIWNSTLVNIHIKAKNCDATISAPLNGFYRFWNSYEHVACENGIVFNVTLHDTDVTGQYWGLSVDSGNLRVENVRDVGSISARNGSLRVTNSSIRNLSCDTKLTAYIVDSNLEYLTFEDSVHANVSGSKTGLLILQNFKGYFHFDMFSAEKVWLNEKTEAYMEGSVRFGENATGGEPIWEGSGGVITRNFDVLTQGGKRVLPEVSLTLYDEEGKQVWSGKTDNNGRAEFNISFCKLWPLYERFKYVNNYEDNWRLEATDGEFTKNATVGLFTDTPIVFAFPSVSEPPLWEQRWLLSAVSATTISVVLVGLLFREIKKTNT